MPEQKILKGFSRLPRQQKRLLVSALFGDPDAALKKFGSFDHPDAAVSAVLQGISENTLTNYPLPYSVAPNFLINGKVYMLPMVTEESSVVAAASWAAGYWAGKGGFKARVSETKKNGQLHFLFTGNAAKLKAQLPQLEDYIRWHLRPVLANMEKRGGGLSSLALADRTGVIDHYFQMQAGFHTADAMGANFINSCLEEISLAMQAYLEQSPDFRAQDFEPLMAILSNYNEDCLVEVSASCDIRELEGAAPGMEVREFARRFALAVKIAETDVHRATTHNKGIMNGVDAVVLATGNDFRAIEAAAHAYAARSGQYRSLSRVSIHSDRFEFSLLMPMSLGTVGGLTGIHPLAAASLEMLGHPGARQLMMIAASAGLANNFAALRSLTTTGIQTGHMRMHLSNILMQLGAGPDESEQIRQHFADKKVSHQAVADCLKKLRETG